MVVISYGALREFYQRHPDSEDALNNWYRATTAGDWKNYHEMKQLFNSVDAVGKDRFVFNIRGNNVRLVALIFFDIRTVYVRFVGFHKEYDKIDCSTI
jgi:mRNA interferase HigB